WLLFQGAEAFEIFSGKKAPIKKMRNAIFSTKGNARIMKNISLIGFMGTGKSAVAKEIAKKNKMENVDIDENIEKNAGMPIKEIFGKFGEKKFRELEAKELKRIIKGKNRVCSCGGGIVLNDKNVNLLKSNSIVAWLWANPETILKRVKGNARPLLNVADKKKKIKELLSERI
ncbi:MAG: shikimate kinase, partial [archaeon]